MKARYLISVFSFIFLFLFTNSYALDSSSRISHTPHAVNVNEVRVINWSSWHLNLKAFFRDGTVSYGELQPYYGGNPDTVYIDLNYDPSAFLTIWTDDGHAVFNDNVYRGQTIKIKEGPYKKLNVTIN